MKVEYQLNIDLPETHTAHITINITELHNVPMLELFLPVWSPGTYLLSEYAAHMSKLLVRDEVGRVLHFEQVAKGSWKIYFKETPGKEVTINYDVYCHETSEVASHIDFRHAFLHGPSLFMGVHGEEIKSPQLSLEFPALWSKVSTGLKDISPQREKFLYEAVDYDALIDTPIEIGCQETDGFRIGKVDHELSYFGNPSIGFNNLKNNIKKIAQLVCDDFGEIPFDRYIFLNRFTSERSGGLEHLNSSVYLFNGERLGEDAGLQDYLSLIAHEYFHSWLGKRLRPIELGPFDYTQENYTRLLWFVEGVTSFMDHLYLLRLEMCTLEEYLLYLQDQIVWLESTPGRRFDSLEDASFNAWIKMYRPNENTMNSTVSYYNKGGLVFFIVNSFLFERNISFIQFLQELWKLYKNNPNKGITKEDIFQVIESISDTSVKEKFETMVTTTEDLELELALERVGLKAIYGKKNIAYWGIIKEFRADQLFVKNVYIDGPAYKAGLSVRDEIIAIDGQEMNQNNFDSVCSKLKSNKAYILSVKRDGNPFDLRIVLENSPREIERINIIDKKKCLKALMVTT